MVSVLSLVWPWVSLTFQQGWSWQYGPFSFRCRFHRLGPLVQIPGQVFPETSVCSETISVNVFYHEGEVMPRKPPSLSPGRLLVGPKGFVCDCDDN